MLQSDFWDYSDTYTAVKGTISVADPSNDPYDKNLTFKNDALFISCFSEINNTLH